jgi:translocation and assembly module TamB
LQLPETLPEQLRRERDPALAALRGQLRLDLTDSVLAGQPMAARLDVQGDGQALGVRASWAAAGNQATLEGRFAVAAPQDHWQLDAALPALAALQPLSGLVPELPARSWPRSGALTLQTQLDGRWPRLRGGSGSLQATDLRAGELGLAEGRARWQFGGGEDAPIEITLNAKGLQQGAQRVDDLQARIDGTLRAHRITAQLEPPARPPAWSENLAGATGTGTRATLEARGAWRDTPAGGGHWQAEDASLRVVARDGKGDPWLDAKGLQGELVFDHHGALMQAQLSPGRALFAGGAALRWSEASWRADGRRLNLRGELEPLAVAPLLARLQPEIGWGGDLTLAGRFEVHAAERFDADVVLARAGGDLRITDETGAAQPMGIDELRLAFAAHDGLWQFAQGLAGRRIGELAGAQVVRTNAQTRWPSADAALEGVVQMRVADLGAWGVWVPPGWRLGGNLRMNASLGGRFGAPELRGAMQGSELSVRNVLQGVGLSDGELVASLEGSLARVQRLSFKGGDGRLQVSGEASLGEAPSARLQLAAERFRVLGRIDRRVIASGNAQLQLNRETLQLDGSFVVDEGLIDFSKTDAPGLDGDVSVVRAASAPVGGSAREQRAAAQATPAPLRNAQVNLAVGLGEKLHIRGHGLDAMLRGDLRLSTTGGRPALNGSVRTATGTYVAYAQKLVIERGELVFSGAPDNPRLDILAIRPNLDVRVGVAVTGLLSSLRVRLYSDPEMPEMDKLSWLMLGRASEGLGRNDMALVQRAALALLAGDDQAPTDQLLYQLGLTDFSVRQGDSDTRETIVSLGRQLSQRWYVGYERSVNTTTGSWQLIYRIAQRFTLRAQSGVDNSLDFIWQWRW